MRAGSMRTFEFTHRIYSGQEMKDLLASPGLAGPCLYGDLDGGSYGFDTQRHRDRETTIDLRSMLVRQ